MKRVLITDDAAFMRISIKNIISKNGYEVAGEAGNGAEAVQKSLPDFFLRLKSLGIEVGKV